MAGGGDVAQDFECVLGVPFNVSDCDKEDHDRIGGLIGIRGCCPTDDALEVCAFKVPAGAIRGPDLYFESAAWMEGSSGCQEVLAKNHCSHLFSIEHPLVSFERRGCD